MKRIHWSQIGGDVVRRKYFLIVHVFLGLGAVCLAICSILELRPYWKCFAMWELAPFDVVVLLSCRWENTKNIAAWQNINPWTAPSPNMSLSQLVAMMQNWVTKILISQNCTSPHRGNFNWLQEIPQRANSYITATLLTSNHMSNMPFGMPCHVCGPFSWSVSTQPWKWKTTRAQLFIWKWWVFGFGAF